MELLCAAETSESRLCYITACSQKASRVSSDCPCFLIISAQFTGYILSVTVWSCEIVHRNKTYGTFHLHRSSANAMSSIFKEYRTVNKMKAGPCPQTRKRSLKSWWRKENCNCSDTGVIGWNGETFLQSEEAENSANLCAHVIELWKWVFFWTGKVEITTIILKHWGTYLCMEINQEGFFRTCGY